MGCYHYHCHYYHLSHCAWLKERIKLDEPLPGHFLLSVYIKQGNKHKHKLCWKPTLSKECHTLWGLVNRWNVAHLAHRNIHTLIHVQLPHPLVIIQTHPALSPIPVRLTFQTTVLGWGWDKQTQINICNSFNENSDIALQPRISFIVQIFLRFLSIPGVISVPLIIHFPMLQNWNISPCSTFTFSIFSACFIKISLTYL